MAKKGENTKKVAGNARKADAASKKQAAANAAAEEEEAGKWEDGSKKGNKKKEDSQFKKEEAARKKAEREALLKAEEAASPTKPASNKQRGAAKIAAKRTGKIDDFLDFDTEKPELKATGIDSALEALSLTTQDGGLQHKDFDKHPERRVKAAYLAYEEWRLPELRKEHPGLRMQQVKNLIHKEFAKSPENPMNQETNVRYNATIEEVSTLKKDVRDKREKRFA